MFTVIVLIIFRFQVHPVAFNRQSQSKQETILNISFFSKKTENKQNQIL